ncbi:LPS translocon maturation chaperone LptM [Stenotrophomonas nitritireducens]|uniref:LPS translocon maturation chaperone LptM n=1 Tax=Stenotrophomonas nitritireducens TaxID=83617 RepID=UPI003D999CCF
MNKTSRLPMLVAAACALLVLTACGNKGPLVMPQKPVPVEEQEVKPADAPADAVPADSQAQDPKDDGHDHE